MRQFSIERTGQRLRLKRDRRKAVLCCLALCALAGVLIAFLSGRFPGHDHIPVEGRMVLFPLLLINFFLLGRLVFILRRREFVFDRALGLVLVNGQPVYPLAELQSVCLERTYCRTFTCDTLFLQWQSGVRTELMRDGLFEVGVREMYRVAAAISRFADVDLITPEGFIPARSKPPALPIVMKRWGGKGRRSPFSRRRRARCGPTAHHTS